MRRNRRVIVEEKEGFYTKMTKVRMPQFLKKDPEKE